MAWRPGEEGIGGDTDEAAASQHQQERGLSPNEFESLAEGGGLAVIAALLDGAALWFADREADNGGQYQARNTRDEECGAPAKLLVDIPADDKAGQYAKPDAGRVDTKREGSFFWRIQV